MPTKSRSSSASKARSSGGKKSSSTSKKGSAAKRRGAGGRELISPKGDSRYVRRGASGQFKESDDVGRSLTADRRRKAKTKSRSGQGDRGDR